MSEDAAKCRGAETVIVMKERKKAMSDSLKIHPGRMDSNAEQIAACVEKMKKELAEMKRSVDQLDRMWDGPGSEAFKRRFDEDMAGMRRLVQMLEAVYRYEGEAKRKYMTCEKKVYGVVSGMEDGM